MPDHFGKLCIKELKPCPSINSALYLGKAVVRATENPFYILGPNGIFNKQMKVFWDKQMLWFTIKLFPDTKVVFAVEIFNGYRNSVKEWKICLF